MILSIFISLLPAALSQFLPMSLQPDVAFGDHNDRFDLTGVFQGRKHKFSSSQDRRRQFAPMNLQPDMAFGDHNDRFDLKDVFQTYQHKFRPGGDERRSETLNLRRSSYVDQLSEPDQPHYRRLDYGDQPHYRRSEYQDQPNYRHSDYHHQPNYRREEDWIEEMTRVADEGRDENDGFYKRAQDFRRRRHHNGKRRNQVETQKQTAVPEREILLKYALPVKIKVQDREDGTFITGINIF